MCSSVLCAFPPHIYVPHFPVSSKAIQYVFTLLHVLSAPRGPPARKSITITTRSCSRRKLSGLFGPYFFHTTSSIHPVFRLFSTVYDRTTVRTSYVSYVPYDKFQNFKFNMTYCTYMFMPDFYARFTVRL